MNQVHKETLTQVENALPNRSGLDVEIFGMEGIPQEVLEQHRNRIIQTFYQEQEDRRIATGNPLPGQGGGGPRKKIKYETPEELKARLAEWRARKAAERTAAESGAPPPAAGGTYVCLQFLLFFSSLGRLFAMGWWLTCAALSACPAVPRSAVPARRAVPAARLPRLPGAARRAPRARRPPAEAAGGGRLLERAQRVDGRRAGVWCGDGARGRHRPGDTPGGGGSQVGGAGEEGEEGEGEDVLSGWGGESRGENGGAAEVCAGKVVWVGCCGGSGVRKEGGLLGHGSAGVV